MKRVFIYVVLVLSVQSSLFSQITFLGLDLSMARFIGSYGFNDPAKIQSVYIDAWNDVMLIESEKYNPEKFYYEEFSSDFRYVKDINSEIIVRDIITNEYYSFETSSAESHIKNMYSGIGSGLGLIYLVESFNKIEQITTIYVILFDMSTGETKYIEKFLGKAAGFGFRNYWLGAVYNVMKKSSGTIRYQE